MLGQRHRCRPNINTVLGQRLVVSGYEENYYHLKRLFGCVLVLAGTKKLITAIITSLFLG